ncbi:site-specific DNA-methyltransferase [Trichormus sp. NMC-1]|uniref:DNA-methyltransferase n=1 Tax=Trichormus sp. NMC-1 TaxID=1853259 RepID=UPI0008DC00CC|nr:site-specific DNA-methyltransferase [Trichormus sp. NMC-1]
MVVGSRLLENIGTIKNYLITPDPVPLFLQADSYALLKLFPDGCIDCVITSPPYWGHRAYVNGGIGLEDTWEDYVNNLLKIFSEIKRVLKPSGSFWLNIGDTYQHKSLVGIPWRVALAMTDEQGWILRNSVIWNKVKGAPDNSKDKLRNVYEPCFHFVKTNRYFYDVDAIRSKPRQSKVVNGSVVSATGVSGIRYRRQIELSTALSDSERANALKALNEVLEEVRLGKLSDFRMIIRGQQRTTHSDSTKISGRARELADRGFYFLRYHPNGSKPSDVWDILPEDTQKRKLHFSPYPEDLCKIPILATCPQSGIILDPFIGTGTTGVVAFQLQRKSIGIDISCEYVNIARERCGLLP